MSILEQNILTLDYWKDRVSYGGQSFPTGSIGCAALNISDEQIARLTELCRPLNEFIAMVGFGSVSEDRFPAARDSLLSISAILRALPPFSCLSFSKDGQDIRRLFEKDYTDNLLAYIRATQTVGTMAAFDGQYRHGVGLLRLIQAMAQLGDTLTIYKQTMTEFAHALHGSERSPEGYATAFAEHFSNASELLLSDPSWMALSNTTVQYVSSVLPEKEIPQLVKRMHYVSFVSMFRSDLFEGLCVGHAPRLCPICGKWFLTTDARQTKYCNGLAPGDKLRRTCRQIGNIRGREMRELADDHPIKAIYTRRMGTITQYLHRGTIDEQTAAEMKRLAKNKLEYALSHVAYANGSYAEEMEQAALLREAKLHL